MRQARTASVEDCGVKVFKMFYFRDFLLQGGRAVAAAAGRPIERSDAAENRKSNIFKIFSLATADRAVILKEKVHASL